MGRNIEASVQYMSSRSQKKAFNITNYDTILCHFSDKTFTIISGESSIIKSVIN